MEIWCSTCRGKGNFQKNTPGKAIPYVGLFMKRNINELINQMLSICFFLDSTQQRSVWHWTTSTNEESSTEIWNSTMSCSTLRDTSNSPTTACARCGFTLRGSESNAAFGLELYFWKVWIYNITLHRLDTIMWLVTVCKIKESTLNEETSVFYLQNQVQMILPFYGNLHWHLTQSYSI